MITLKSIVLIMCFALASAHGAFGTWTATNTSAAQGADSAKSVWTGSKIFVFGGLSSLVALNTGGLFDPVTNSWTALSTVGIPSPRFGHTIVWTGTEVIVWGGRNGTTSFRDGARYNPDTNQWRSISEEGSPSPRGTHCAVWTGSEMVIWGGSSGGQGHTTALRDGARYNPVTNTWTPLSAVNAPSAREEATCVWTGSKMIVWAGKSGADLPGNWTNTGGVYDPSTDTWVATSTTGAPSARWRCAGVWTGTEMLVFGGYWLSNTGGHYNPTTNTWSVIGSTGKPSARDGNTFTMVGNNAVIWGVEVAPVFGLEMAQSTIRYLEYGQA